MFDLTEWCLKFFQSPVETMDQDLSLCLTSMVIAELNDTQNPKVQAAIEAQFLYKVIESKFVAYNLRATKFLKIFLFTLCKNPAQVTMYTVALKDRMVRSGLRTLDLRQMCMYFPDGFLTQAALSELWDAQKISHKEREERSIFNDNHLDLCEV